MKKSLQNIAFGRTIKRQVVESLCKMHRDLSSDMMMHMDDIGGGVYDFGKFVGFGNINSLVGWCI